MLQDENEYEKFEELITPVEVDQSLLYEKLKEAARTGNPKEWADQYLSLLRQFPPPVVDEALMEAWFSTAIMVGYDLGYEAAMKNNFI